MIKDWLLTIELIPQSSFFSNVRSHVSQKEWDLIRKQVYTNAKNVCEICGGVGPKHPIEAHEIWHYDDKTLVQKLVGMIGLCPNCHSVKHIGLAQIQGRAEKALKHFMVVNKVSKKEADKYLEDSFEEWDKRSKKKWKLDISILNQYGIDTNKIKGK